VSMDRVLTEVRALGAVNVVVADGLVDAQQLTGAPQLNDPLNQVAYASHPYATSQPQQTKASWAQKFGDFAQTAPVIITEWGVGYFCDSDTPESVVKFLHYIQNQGVGLEAVAWDWDLYDFASAVQGSPSVIFSSLLTLAIPTGCSAANNNMPGHGQGPGTAYGPGKMVESWYLTGVIPSKPE
jgi:endoglucanase